MKKTVLFSPIGYSDPVRGDYDGPMLHILRHHQPDKAAFFLTAEIAANEREYGWYSGFAQAVSPKTEMEWIYSGIEDASVFEQFIPRFEAEIRRLAAENPNCEMLLNMSSGTPQMLSALCVLASALPFDIVPIQVKTHEKRANNRLAHTRPSADIDRCLANLIDNDPTLQPENRCHRVNLDNYVRRQVKDSLRAQIVAGAYGTAYATAQSNKAYLDEPLLTAVKGAYLRKDFQFKEAYQLFKTHHPDSVKAVFPLIALPETKVLEYYLGMRNDYEQADYARFFVRLSPFAEEIAKYALKARCGFDIELYLKNEYFQPNKLKIERPDVFESVEKRMGRALQEGRCSLTLYSHIMAHYQSEKPDIAPLYERFRALLKFQRTRNEAAHLMTAITSLDVEKTTDMTVPAFLSWLDQLFLDAMAGSAIKASMLENYREMSDLLLSML